MLHLFQNDRMEEVYIIKFYHLRMVSQQNLVDLYRKSVI